MPSKPNTSADHIAISGYDPVSYFDGSPLKGEAAYTSEHEGAIYQFANETNKSRFDATPTEFAPQYGGWCAVAASEGKYFPVNPETYEISNDKLYLFYNGEQGNTLPHWEQDRETRRLNADQHWSTGDLVDAA